MKKTELTPDIKASILGFGCAPIMGSVNLKTAKYALDMALEYGVNYFDIARSYGYGEAEGVLGKMIKDRKNDVYVATKFGIIPNWKAGMLNQVKPMVRYVMSLKKARSSQPTKIGNRFLDHVVPLRPDDMKKSLEKSLSELKRNYVDFLFIHEPHHSIGNIDELIVTAETLKKEGKIRCFGLASMHSQEDLHNSYIERFDITQYNNPLIRTDYKQFVSKNAGQPSIIFSPFSTGLNTMNPAEKLTKLFHDFPNSVVLCSMFNPDHIKQNIKLAESIKF
ncbi:aldo/keto reductase [Christiangramia sp. LLG6405-1]|uniref:aldo/keto reductase n=1 Tax=Christiangramia sp. LLG6405-1 TaxID=3160832 RepID=UPI00386702AE